MPERRRVPSECGLLRLKDFFGALPFGRVEAGVFLARDGSRAGDSPPNLASSFSISGGRVGDKSRGKLGPPEAGGSVGERRSGSLLGCGSVDPCPVARSGDSRRLFAVVSECVPFGEFDCSCWDSYGCLRLIGADRAGDGEGLRSGCLRVLSSSAELALGTRCLGPKPWGVGASRPPASWPVDVGSFFLLFL